MAIVVVLSVFNGFASLAERQMGRFDADLRIEPAAGKTLAAADSLRSLVASMPEVAGAAAVIDERALAVSGTSQMPVRIKGHHNGHYRYGHTAHSHAAYDIDGGMAFARVQVASGYFKGLQEGRHCAGSGSFLEQMVDVLYIVQGIVEHECQFRGLAQLEAYPLGELVAHGSGAGVDAFEHGRAFVAGKYG